MAEGAAAGMPGAEAAPLLDVSARLPLGVRLGYGGGEWANSVVWTLFYALVLYFLTDVVRIGAATAGLIMMVGTLWSAVIQPLVGVWSDRLESSRGRRRPFLIATAVPYGIAAWLLFTDWGLGGAGTVAYMIVAVLFYFTCLALFYVPYGALAAELTRPADPVARLRRGAATLTLTHAREFWPLFGDVASQERSGSRLVDSSGARLEAVVETPEGEDPGTLGAMGWRVPLVPLGPGRHVAGIRYRAFVPNPGFHPGLPASDPLRLWWEIGGTALAIDLHGWIPGGGVYDGLPRDEKEAARRRAERVVVREETLVEPRPGSTTPTSASPVPLHPHGLFTVDLRRLPPAS